MRIEFADLSLKLNNYYESVAPASQADASATFTLLEWAKNALGGVVEAFHHTQHLVDEPVQKKIAELKSVNSLLGLTPAKTKIIALRTFSAGCGISGASLIGLAAVGLVTWPVGAISLPILATAGLAFWQSCRIDDYDDPVVLNTLRDEAASLTLAKIIKRHGLQNIFQYQIVTPDDFASLYRADVQYLSLNQVFELYEKTCQEYAAARDVRSVYEIPHPNECKDKWKEETHFKTCVQIFNQYSLERLEKYEIIEIGDQVILKHLSKQYNSARHQSESEVRAINKAFDDATVYERLTLQNTKTEAQNQYDLNWAHQSLAQIEKRYKYEVKLIEKRRDDYLQLAQNHFDKIETHVTQSGVKTYDELAFDEMEMLSREQAELEKIMSEAKTSAEQQLSEVYAGYYEDKQRCQYELAQAAVEKERVDRLAQQQYDLTTVPQKLARDQKLDYCQQQLEASLAVINQKYEAFRQN